MSVPDLGSHALWLSSNPRVSVLELVESLSDHLDEPGAVSNNCSDTCAVQIRRWETLVTNTEKQTTQTATDEEAARDLT